MKYAHNYIEAMVENTIYSGKLWLWITLLLSCDGIHALVRNLNNNKNDTKRSAIVCALPGFKLDSRSAYRIIKRVLIPEKLHSVAVQEKLELADMLNMPCSVFLHTRVKPISWFLYDHRIALHGFNIGVGLTSGLLLSYKLYTRKFKFRDLRDFIIPAGIALAGEILYRRYAGLKRADRIFYTSEREAYAFPCGSLWRTDVHQATLGECIRKGVIPSIVPFPATQEEADSNDISRIPLPLIIQWSESSYTADESTKHKLAVKRLIQCIYGRNCINEIFFEYGTILTLYPDISLEDICAVHGIPRA